MKDKVMQANENSFRISSKKLFLTYPQCSIPLNDVLNQLKIIFDSYIIESYVISQEQHIDGNPHLHCFIKTFKKNCTRNCRKFDLVYNGTTFHGKYESVKHENNTIEYILKDIVHRDSPNYLISSNLAERVHQLGIFMGVDQTIIQLAENGNINRALELYKEAKPAQFLANHDHIRKSLTKLALLKSGWAKPKFQFKDFILDKELQKILDNYNQNKTLILVGQPGTGKTQFITSFIQEILGINPLVINNLDAIRYFNPDKHGAIVFDDCPAWDNKTREEIIKLIDSEVPTTHDIKHGSVLINNSTPRFLILNPPLPYNLTKKDKAIQRRIQIVQLNQSLIPTPPTPSPTDLK